MKNKSLVIADQDREINALTKQLLNAERQVADLKLEVAALRGQLQHIKDVVNGT